jgi:membrane peptidoglycan carboxypeptidase
VSSRDFSGPYGPEPPDADDYGGYSGRDRAVSRGSGDNYGVRGSGYAGRQDGHAPAGRGARRGGYGEGNGGYGPGGGYRRAGDGYPQAGAGYEPGGGGYRGGRREGSYGPGDWNGPRRRDAGRGGRGTDGRPAGSTGGSGRSGRYGTTRRADRYSGGYGPGGTAQGEGRSGGRGGGARGGGGSGPGRGKVTGSWWRHWTWRKALGIAAAGAGGLVLAAVAGVSYAYAKTTVPSAASQAALQQQSTVYFSGGKTAIGTFGSTDRQLLQYNQIPAVMRDAVVAAEDRSFYTEGAISPRGMLRAAYEDVFHGGGSSGSLAGGSTITQEFVRNYYSNIGTQQTFSRKIKEIFVALKVSKEKSKDWILTNYLNTIYLGDGAYGVGAAAQTYFGEPISKLNVAQAAMIAAIIQSPSYYPTPAGHPALVTRWHYVLGGLAKMGDITPAQAAAEKFPAMNSTQQQQAGADPYDPYILNVVQNELEDVYKYTPSQIENDGLHIVTTISKPMMDELYSAVNQNKQLMAEDGGALPSYALIGAELQNPQTGAIVAMYPGPGQNYSQAECNKIHCDENAAVYTREQVGSSFKPYVLSTAVQQGMNVKTSTLDGDSPLWIPPDSEPTTYASTTPPPPGSGGYYKVTNDSSDGSQGPSSVQKATAMSLNTAYTDLIHRVGTQNVINLAKQFGVDTQASGLQADVGQVGIALGQNSLSVNEQDTMLATLDDNGMYHSAHVIQQITQGNAVYRAQVISRQVLTAAQDSQVQYAMSADTLPGGTATAAAMTDGRPIIGKTGTTNDAQSAFFIGAIPQYALTVGIFTDKQGNTTETLNGLGGSVGGGFGGYWPARIWHTFAETEFAQLPIQQFLAPQFTGQAWNMLSPAMRPAPAPPKKTHPATQPTSPGKGNPKRTPPTIGPTVAPTPTAQPTCGNLFGSCGGGGGGGGTGGGGGGGTGGGGGGPGGGGPGGGTAGLVALVPMRWLVARRKRKRS